MADKPQVNPFEPDNFLTGGGLWDGKVVTVLSAKARMRLLGRQDSPYLNKEGKTVPQNGIAIVGLAEDTEMEREEFYSAGGTYIPTEDGEGFVDIKTKQPRAFSENSGAAKFSVALKDSGFDVTRLWDEKTKRTKLSGLVGAQFRMKAVKRLDKKGEVKLNKKGYEENAFFPGQFIGFKAGVGSVAATVSDALREKAAATFLAILNEAPDQKLTRIQAIKGISAALAGDPDANKVIALLGKTDFHTDQPWKVDSTGYSL
jgi:hypothetical protein